MFQLLIEENKKIKDENEHFHSVEKQCAIKPQKQIGHNRQGTVNGAYCKTHDVMICHCGWEWEWHGGEKIEKHENN